MKHVCDKEREIDLIHKGIDEIKKDVKDLNVWRWKVIGVFCVLIFIIEMSIKVF